MLRQWGFPAASEARPARLLPADETTFEGPAEGDRSTVIMVPLGKLGALFSRCQASGSEQFLELSRSRQYELILLDLRLLQFDGLELLRLFREHCKKTTVVLITGQASLSTATDALAKF